MAKKRMPLYGIICTFRDFSAHKLTKYEYFSMKPILFVQYYQFTYSLHVSTQYILKCVFYVHKTTTSAQNRPYLSLQLLPNCCHQKSFTPYIFQYFRLKF